MLQVTQFWVLTFCTHMHLSRWQDHCGPRGNTSPDLPGRISGAGQDTKEESTGDTCTETDASNDDHICLNFPASRTVLAKQRQSNHVAGRHAAPQPLRQLPSLLGGCGCHLGISKEDMWAPGGGSCSPPLFPADSTLGGRSCWLSSVWGETVIWVGLS